MKFFSKNAMHLICPKNHVFWGFLTFFFGQKPGGPFSNICPFGVKIFKKILGKSGGFSWLFFPQNVPPNMFLGGPF